MNSRRMNRLEELGRVDAERARTRKGKRNLKDEKKRIVRELKADGGKIKKLAPGVTKSVKKIMDRSAAKNRDLKKVQPNQKGLKKLPRQVRNKMGYMKKGGRVGMGKAMRGGGCVR